MPRCGENQKISGAGLTFDAAFGLIYPYTQYRLIQEKSVMAGPLRIEFAGALYHLTARENARQEIFLHDNDRNDFLELPARACDRYDWR